MTTQIQSTSNANEICHFAIDNIQCVRHCLATQTQPFVSDGFEDERKIVDHLLSMAILALLEMQVKIEELPAMRDFDMD